MRKFSLLFAILSVCLISTSFADNGSGTVDTLTLGQVLDYTENSALLHNDQDVGYGFKGTYTLTVTNTGTEAWGDFHFEISNGFGGNANSVLFTDLALGGINPTSSQSGLTWLVDNPVGDLSSIDLFFYSDPVGAGETATFVVYTDNTAEELSWFGMCVYPTPVPEPATLSLLGLGALTLLRRKK
ncbi:MAG: PEP-CTERM sorting domain-containing protein [Planctomycetes bacterium]|nr:PEP-CTERM sorting domain-containing protein [Planctomycetota bacterium]